MNILLFFAFHCRDQVDPEKAKGVKFMPMEVTNIVSVVDLRNKIYEEHGQIDILINNAGMYFYPALDATEHFVQVQRTLDINYWGLKNVINAFLPMMSDTARIVNMNSNYGHVSHIPTRRIKQKLGKIAIISRMNILKLFTTIVADPNLTERELDEMIMDYQRHCTEFNDDFEILGWPRCSYTVSKVAVNAYTRILQKQLEEKGTERTVKI